MERIHLIDFPKTKIYALFRKSFRKKIIEKAKEKMNAKNYYRLALYVNEISRKYKLKTKFNGGDVKYWVIGHRTDTRTNKVHPKFMPLWVPLELADLVGIPTFELESNLYAYRSGNSGSIIEKPKMPIPVTPELESIIIHLFADGQAGNFTPSYFQFSKKLRENFIKKLKNCFGKFNITIYENKGHIRFPKAITDILVKYYNIRSFKSSKCKIPKKIMKRDKLHKLACSLAFISDEGYIRDLVHLYSANKLFISQIRKMLIDCGYKCNPLHYGKIANSYNCTLSNKTFHKFLFDVKELSKEYSTCEMGLIKKLKFLQARIENKKPRNRGIADNKILKELAKNKLTTNQIAERINYMSSTIRYHLENLEKRGIAKHKKVRREYLWSLSKKN